MTEIDWLRNQQQQG